MPEHETRTFSGKPLSPGFAEGLIHLHRERLGPIDPQDGIEQEAVEAECSRLEQATIRISDDLLALAARVEQEIDSRLSGIFGAHAEMVTDISLKDELKREIADNLMSASSAVKTVFLRWEKRFLLMESQVSRDKSEDMRDISVRLCNELAGITAHPLERLPPGSILVASRLLPSDTVFLGREGPAAVILEHGSISSHAALFVREMGIPAISGIAGLLARFTHGAPALVDACEGTITLYPETGMRAAFQKKADSTQHRFQLTRTKAQTPAVTADGVQISVLANVGCRADTEMAMANGGEGVGLYRIEQAYLGRTMPPDVDELLAEMRQTLEPARGHTACVRLLDIGGDKMLPFMKFMAESNPSLGRRGIRLLREYPELLDTHLRALLALAEDVDVRILVPMVTLPDDVRIVHEALQQLGEELRLDSLPKLGAMIETPAAALSAPAIGKHVDFLSFGTNDLTQYTFAADRENAVVEPYFDDGAEAIFRLLQLTHDDVPAMPLAVCGELAGRPEHIARLLQCGIRTLSVAPPLIPAVKEAIRGSRCDGRGGR